LRRRIGQQLIKNRASGYATASMRLRERKEGAFSLVQQFSRKPTCEARKIVCSHRTIHAENSGSSAYFLGRK
jgi:hypothetical protein